LTIRSLCLV